MTSRIGTVGPRVPICSGVSRVTLWNGGIRVDLPNISYRRRGSMFCHIHQTRSRLAWCKKKSGSNSQIISEVKRPPPAQLTSWAGIIIAHLSTDAKVPAVVHLVGAGVGDPFEFDAEELERRLPGSVGHGSGSEVWIIIVLNITGEAVVGDEFSRTKMQDIIFEWAIAYATFPRCGIYFIAGEVYVLGKRVGSGYPITAESCNRVEHWRVANSERKEYPRQPNQRRKRI